VLDVVSESCQRYESWCVYKSWVCMDPRTVNNSRAIMHGSGSVCICQEMDACVGDKVRVGGVPSRLVDSS
jgi:hypothetical protein